MSADTGLGIIVAGAIGSVAGGGTTRRPTRSIGAIVANVTVEERHRDDMEITDHPIEQGALVSDHAFKRPAEVTITVAWSNSPSAPAGLLGGITGSLLDKVSGSVQNALQGIAAKAIGGSALGNLAVAKLGDLKALGLETALQVDSGRGVGTSAVQDVYRQLIALQLSAVPITVYTGKRAYRNMVIRSVDTDTTTKTENALVAVLVCREVFIVQTQVVAVSAAPADQANPLATAPIANDGAKQVAAASTDPSILAAAASSWSA